MELKFKDSSTDRNLSVNTLMKQVKRKIVEKYEFKGSSYVKLKAFFCGSTPSGAQSIYFIFEEFYLGSERSIELLIDDIRLVI